MLVLADDLSGAVETAAVLGVPRVSLDPGDTAGAVVDLDTRALDADEAARRVRALVAARGDGLVFKKLDSLLRGHVAAEVGALAGGPVIVTPALPVEGRTVRGGVLHVDGVAQPGVGVDLRDAETDADLDALVEEALALPNVRLAGSAGLAAALGRRLGATQLPPPDPSRRPLLVAIGTAAAGEQIEHLATAGVPVVALEEAEREPAALAAALGAAAPGARLCDAGLSLRRAVAVRIGEPVEPDGLCRRLAAVVAAAPPVDLVLTGGETARRTLEALGVSELRLVAQVHHGAVQSVTPDGRRVTTRPGGFGGPYSLVRIVEAVA